MRPARTMTSACSIGAGRSGETRVTSSMTTPSSPDGVVTLEGLAQDASASDSAATTIRDDMPGCYGDARAPVPWNSRQPRFDDRPDECRPNPCEREWRPLPCCGLPPAGLGPPPLRAPCRAPCDCEGPRAREGPGPCAGAPPPPRRPARPP